MFKSGDCDDDGDSDGKIDRNTEYKNWEELIWKNYYFLLSIWWWYFMLNKLYLLLRTHHKIIT